MKMNNNNNIQQKEKEKETSIKKEKKDYKSFRYKSKRQLSEDANMNNNILKNNIQNTQITPNEPKIKINQEYSNNNSGKNSEQKNLVINNNINKVNNFIEIKPKQRETKIYTNNSQIKNAQNTQNNNNFVHTIFISKYSKKNNDNINPNNDTNTNNDKLFSNTSTTVIRNINIKPDKEKESANNNINNNSNINPNNNYRFKTHYVNPLKKKEKEEENNNNNKKMEKTISSNDISNKRKNIGNDINIKKNEIKKEEPKTENDDGGIFKNSIRNKYKRRKND